MIRHKHFQKKKQNSTIQILIVLIIIAGIIFILSLANNVPGIIGSIFTDNTLKNQNTFLASYPDCTLSNDNHIYLRPYTCEISEGYWGFVTYDIRDKSFVSCLIKDLSTGEWNEIYDVDICKKHIDGITIN